MTITFKPRRFPLHFTPRTNKTVFTSRPKGGKR